jgi:lipopolysaccharide transport system ATP-binding protein
MNVIQLEQVGKRYWLRHRAPDRRLMEVLHDGGRALAGIFTGRRPVKPPTGEEFWALREISLQIQAGEVIGLIGRNGAGKSTLLKLISRIMAPTTGRIGVRGRMGCLLEVGSGFHPELTGRENVFLNGAILGMSLREIRQKFDQIVSFAEVEAFLDTPVKHYSSGMFVRLAFAVAALLDPEILIVDEVLSVGDAGFQKKALSAIQDAVHRGTTCLMVSHHLPSVTSLCRRAVLLQAGRLIADGLPEDVVRQYLMTARQDGGEHVWSHPETAPGNDEVRLQAVRIRQPHVDQPTADVDISHEIGIELQFEKLAASPELTTTLLLKDHAGTTVLMSSSAKSLRWQPADDSTSDQLASTYQTRCTIPANLLNEGRYSVTVQIGRGINQPYAIAEDCVTFDVHDTGEQRGLYAGAWPGVIRPRLDWSSQSALGNSPRQASF